MYTTYSVCKKRLGACYSAKRPQEANQYSLEQKRDILLGPQNKKESCQAKSFSCFTVNYDLNSSDRIILLGIHYMLIPKLLRQAQNDCKIELLLQKKHVHSSKLLILQGFSAFKNI
jgi:hypothetical protein